MMTGDLLVSALKMTQNRAATGDPHAASGFILPIPILPGGLSFYPQGDSNEHYELLKEREMSLLLRRLAEDNPDKLPLSPDEKYSQSIFLGLEFVDEKDANRDSFFEDSDDFCYENDDDSGWTQAMHHFQKYGSNGKFEGSGLDDSEINFGLAPVLQTFTDEESLSEVNSKSDEEDSIKSSKQDVIVLSEKGPSPTSKQKSPEGKESHDENKKIHPRTHEKDSRGKVRSEEPQESLSEINSKSNEEDSIKSSKQDVIVLSEKGPSPSKHKSPEGKVSCDYNKKFHHRTHKKDSSEKVSSEKEPETIQNNAGIKAAAKKSLYLAEMKAAAKKSLDLARPKVSRKRQKSCQTGSSAIKKDEKIDDLLISTDSEKLGKPIIQFNVKSPRIFGRKGRHSSHIRKDKKGKTGLSKIHLAIISIIAALFVYSIYT